MQHKSFIRSNTNESNVLYDTTCDFYVATHLSLKIVCPLVEKSQTLQRQAEMPSFNLIIFQ